MEQFITAFGIDWKIFTAETINFLVVFVILTLVFYKKLFKIIEDRQKLIKEGVEKAQKAGETLKEADDQKRKIITEARSEAGEKIKKAEKVGQEKAVNIVEKAKEDSTSILEKAQKAGEELKEATLKEADKEIAKLAILGAEKILSQK